MKHVTRFTLAGVALALLTATTGCLVEPREDYYDRGHQRYYHEHAWHACGDRDRDDRRCRDRD
jgi:hypothetical protein